MIETEICKCGHEKSLHIDHVLNGMCIKVGCDCLIYEQRPMIVVSGTSCCGCSGEEPQTLSRPNVETEKHLRHLVDSKIVDEYLDSFPKENDDANS